MRNHIRDQTEEMSLVDISTSVYAARPSHLTVDALAVAKES